jgi:hypothetical protein
MKRLFTIGGIALALLLSACATGKSAGGSAAGWPQLERQDIIKQMKGG